MRDSNKSIQTMNFQQLLSSYEGLASFLAFNQGNNDEETLENTFDRVFYTKCHDHQVLSALDHYNQKNQWFLNQSISCKHIAEYFNISHRTIQKLFENSAFYNNSIFIPRITKSSVGTYFVDENKNGSFWWTTLSMDQIYRILCNNKVINNVYLVKDIPLYFINWLNVPADFYKNITFLDFYNVVSDQVHDSLKGLGNGVRKDGVFLHMYATPELKKISRKSIKFKCKDVKPWKELHHVGFNGNWYDSAFVTIDDLESFFIETREQLIRNNHYSYNSKSICKLISASLVCKTFKPTSFRYKKSILLPSNDTHLTHFIFDESLIDVSVNYDFADWKSKALHLEVKDQDQVIKTLSAESYPKYLGKFKVSIKHSNQIKDKVIYFDFFHEVDYFIRKLRDSIKSQIQNKESQKQLELAEQNAKDIENEYHAHDESTKLDDINFLLDHFSDWGVKNGDGHFITSKEFCCMLKKSRRTMQTILQNEDYLAILDLKESTDCHAKGYCSYKGNQSSFAMKLFDINKVVVLLRKFLKDNKFYQYRIKDFQSIFKEYLEGWSVPKGTQKEADEEKANYNNFKDLQVRLDESFISHNSKFTPHNKRNTPSLSDAIAGREVKIASLEAEVEKLKLKIKSLESQGQNPKELNLEPQDSKEDIFSDAYTWSDQQGKVIKGSLSKHQFDPDHILTKDCYITLGEVVYPVKSLAKENQSDLLKFFS